MLSWIVAENRNGSSVTSAIAWRRLCRSTERTSAPSIRTDPELTSYSRGSSDTSAVLPEPIAPTSATVRPGSISRSTSLSAGWVAPSNVRLTSRSDTRPGPSGSAGAFSGLVICGSRSSISKIRAPGRGRALGGAQHVPERPHRRDQHQQIRVERGELPDRQRSVDHVAPADQQDQGQAEVRQEADQRRVPRLDPRREHLLVEHPRHRVLEAAELALLLGERLDHADAGHVLLGLRGQLGDPLLRLLNRRPRPAAVQPRDHDHERHRRERQRRQRRLEREHRDRREPDRQDRLGDEDQAVPEEEADRLQVDGGARHQLPGLLAVEERELERLQGRVQRLAQVDFDGQRHPPRDQPARRAQRQPGQAGGEDREHPHDQMVAVGGVGRRSSSGESSRSPGPSGTGSGPSSPSPRTRVRTTTRQRAGRGAGSRVAVGR